MNKIQSQATEHHLGNTIDELDRVDLLRIVFTYEVVKGWVEEVEGERVEHPEYDKEDLVHLLADLVIMSNEVNNWK